MIRNKLPLRSVRFFLEEEKEKLLIMREESITPSMISLNVLMGLFEARD